MRARGVIGVKQGIGDLRLVAELVNKLGDKGLVLNAHVLMYSAFALGAHGSIAAILAAVPTLM
jgi:4-hydroxy-tetrahydrodipicolinate synthase